MINLLPPEIVRERLARYKDRQRIVSGGLFIVALAIVIVSLGSLHLGLYFRRQALEASLAVTKSQTETIALTAQEEDLTRLAKQTQNLSSQSLGESHFSVLLDQILSKRNQGIRITNLAYTETSEGTMIQIAGVALSRQALLIFVEQFKQDPTFAAVDSPISNLIKDRDAAFTLTLTISPKS